MLVLFVALPWFAFDRSKSAFPVLLAAFVVAIWLLNDQFERRRARKQLSPLKQDLSSGLVEEIHVVAIAVAEVRSIGPTYFFQVGANEIFYFSDFLLDGEMVGPNCASFHPSPADNFTITRAPNSREILDLRKGGAPLKPCAVYELRKTPNWGCKDFDFDNGHIFPGTLDQLPAILAKQGYGIEAPL